ncbi:uncharacterized protein LOC117770422 isoform X1 [Hippoglossus hippoglossus]|uniref:uncharacterized protein LOC117770422 isoform X1 n=1 Tax=Hippoglossus hippoglossus TaxID=8267 RepID=UPI00148E8149|nr:uncharacterized protein LOC117770422 isoform X1 [Hippoglossus hippoglossus]XP_034455766.1 uncharacterized protein LOC117770422 isoform X2 [Hippoglossus hippoglossus]XP_034455767.1 uncharacterized protein LOC117770422 isoform X1 [Hippoglossus hippoglossus]
MTCAIHLMTFWLICLFQAEHVRCLWATQTQGSQRPSDNAYVGFSRQDSGPRRDGGSNPQNKFRQASFSPHSAQSSSLNPGPAVNRGYDRGFSSSGYTQTVSQPAHSGYASVRLVESSPVSNPNWKTTDSKRVNAKSILGLSTSIVSGSAMSKHSQKQNSLSARTRPTQQGTQRTNQHLSRNSASAQSPTFSAQANYPPSSKSSSMFSAGAPVPEHGSVRKHTSATVRAQRVSSQSNDAASRPSSFSVPQNDRIRNDPSQAADRFKSKMFTVTGGSAQGDYPQSAFVPRSLGGSQGLNYDPRYTSAEMPSRTRPASSLWNTRTQGGGGFRVTGRSSQQFAPTITHSIPNRLGGSPIRRLRGSSDQKQVFQTPQLKYTAPSQQTASYNPQGQSVQPESKWKMVSRLHQ